MSSLIRGNELELAACVGLVLGEAANQSTAYCLALLARKYMTTPTWYVSTYACPVCGYSTFLEIKVLTRTIWGTSACPHRITLFGSWQNLFRKVPPGTLPEGST